MRITFYPKGEPTVASSRLRVWKLLSPLRAMGHEVCVNGYPFESDVVVIQKRFDMNNLMIQCRQRGVRVIWDCDDWLEGGPVSLADVVTVDTEYKRKLYQGAVVIPDCLDVEDIGPCKTEHARTLTRVGWFGNAENLDHARNMMEACRLLNLTPVMITNTLIRPVGLEWHPWDLTTIDKLLVGCDVVACPYIVKDGQADWVNSKSANRLLKAWGLGLPAIGSPIPSYVDAGLRYCATTVDEWVEAFKALSERRDRIWDGSWGMVRASAYRADNVAKLWIDVLEKEKAE